MKRSLTSFLFALSIALIIPSLVAAYSPPNDPAKVTPLKTGDRAPNFTVRMATGADYRFDASKLDKPAVLIFYRGGWCPYCNAHLAALRNAEPELLAMGYDVLFMSTDRPELLYPSLKEKDIRYTLLSDSKMQASRAFGVAYRLDDAIFARYKNMGLDLEATTGETHHELPVPAVFIVDKAGVIRFAHWNPDYKVRLGADEILAAARTVLNR